MRLDDLLKPVSADAPCGEDLLIADDPDFIDYYFNVEDRLPTSYFNVVRGTLFDAKSLDQKAETAQIDALLKRSRDLRLLALEAKFQALTGRFKGFAEAVLGVARLMEAYPDAVHPVDPVDRRNAIEELNALATIAAPLEYAPLMTDKRFGDVLYRTYATGTGKIAPREGEVPGDSGGVLGALGSSENIKVVDALHGQLVELLAAVKAIETVCQTGPGRFTPTLDRLKGRLQDIHDMILQARTDLGGAPAESADAGGEAGGAETGGAAGAPGSTTFTISAAPAGVPDHRAAWRLLGAVERYFAMQEPSSLAMILVMQSRKLIGRPLVEALDTLLEYSSANAVLNLGGENNMSISMSKMRELSGYAMLPVTEEWENPVEGDEELAEVVSRDHAGQILKSVEDYFRMREPASPIPILLFKARNMLSKDFHAIVRELLPPAG